MIPLQCHSPAVDQFSNVKDFFTEQAKDLKPGIGILMQQAQEFLARNEV